MRRQFIIAIPKVSGGIETHPMKNWIREHPQHLPPGMEVLDVRHTHSTQVAKALEKLGWTVAETVSEVQLTPPDALTKLSVTIRSIDFIVRSDAKK